ncbi:MAG: META domain-containing protein [Bacteroidota bacterium]
MYYKLSILLVILYILAGCKPTRNLSRDIGQQPPDNGRFELVLINHLKIETADGQEQVSVRFSREERQISGYAGCNRFFGSYAIKSDTLIIGGLASTKMACRDMQIEDRLLSSLNNSLFKLQLIDDTLILTNPSDTLTFRRSATEP